MSVYSRRAERLSLTLAQRKVIDNDNVGWVGWDAARLPVITNPQGERLALDRAGLPVDVTEPVVERES